MTGDPWGRLFAPGDPFVDGALACLRRGEEVRERSGRCIDRSGAVRPIVWTMIPIAGPAGSSRALAVARDEAHLDHAQRASQRLAAIVNSSDDAIVSKDLNGIVTTWNHAAEVMFGYTAAEMVGTSIRRIIPADRQAEEDQVLAKVRQGDKVEHFETVRRRKDGSPVYISLTVSPLVDERGAVVGASKIARDIGERRRADEERLRLLALAERNVHITERLNKVGNVVASTLDRERVVQAVTDAAATELTNAQFGAFFYNLVNERGEGVHPLYNFRSAARHVREISDAAQHSGVRANLPRHRRGSQR